MATMPVYFDDLESSLKATMIFPREPQKAAALTAWLAIRDLRKAAAADRVDAIVSTLTSDAMREFIYVSCAASDFAQLHAEALQNLRSGAHVALVISYFWAFICEEWHGASLERAIKAVEKQLVRQPGSRSSFFEELKAFKPVLHLLGTRAILKRTGLPGDLESIVQFAGHPDPSVDYARRTDVLMFAAEARKFHFALLVWDAKRPTGGQLLDEMFDLIGPWIPPPSQPQWPKTLKFRGIGLDDEIIKDPQFIKRRPGKKPKSQSN
jgi:hypothetical protein